MHGSEELCSWNFNSHFLLFLVYYTFSFGESRVAKWRNHVYVHGKVSKLMSLNSTVI